MSRDDPETLAAPRQGQDKMRPKPLLELELRPVAAPAHASEGACVYVLLPTLEELVGRPDFGRPDPIWLPGSRAWIDGWTMFGRSRAWTLH
jgi:hypothetical protein